SCPLSRKTRSSHVARTSGRRLFGGGPEGARSSIKERWWDSFSGMIFRITSSLLSPLWRGAERASHGPIFALPPVGAWSLPGPGGSRDRHRALSIAMPGLLAALRASGVGAGVDPSAAHPLVRCIRPLV